MLAQRRGLRIHEVPVDWVDDPDSRVDIVHTAITDLKGVARLLAGGPIAKFMGIGVLSTIAYALIYVLLAPLLGALGANAAALALTAVANTAANRRYTFGVRGKEDLARHHVRGALVFVLTLALTNGALSVLHGLDPDPARGAPARGADRGDPDRDGDPLRRDAHLGLHPRAPRAAPVARPGEPLTCRRSRSRARRSWTRPNWVKLSFAGILVLAAAPVPLESDDQRLLERVLRRGRPRRLGELEGVVLRRDRPRQLHHGRQAAALAVAEGLSARVLGFSSLSVLLPQALCTIAAVALLFATVRRVAGDAAGLIAALAFALSTDHDRGRARQQPRRAARPAAGGERLLHGPRARVRARPSTSCWRAPSSAWPS